MSIKLPGGVIKREGQATVTTVWRHWFKRADRFSKTDKTPLAESVFAFLDRPLSQALAEPENPSAFAPLAEAMEMLFSAESPEAGEACLQWVLQQLQTTPPLPDTVIHGLLTSVNAWQNPVVAETLLTLLPQLPPQHHEALLTWLVSLRYDHGPTLSKVIGNLIDQHITRSTVSMPITTALKHLDTYDSQVTDHVMQRFPQPQPDQNHRLIQLMGHLGKPRVVKPLRVFADENPSYLRSVMRAFSDILLDEVDAFYVECLYKYQHLGPMVLIDAVKQVRKRQLRQAIPYMENLFPMETSPLPLVNRALNGEIAVTMATFRVYAWAREKLLSEMVLSGLNPHYLKAIDMLQLEEAVPLLKAVLLMPETPEIRMIQAQAFQVCSRILTRLKERHPSPAKPY